MYVKITPSLAQSSLRRLARGKEPKISVTALALYFIACAQPPETRRKDDSVQFLERMYALEDPRDRAAKVLMFPRTLAP